MTASTINVAVLADRLAARVILWLTEADAPLEQFLGEIVDLKLSTLEEDRKAVAALLIPIIEDAIAKAGQ